MVFDQPSLLEIEVEVYYSYCIVARNAIAACRLFSFNIFFHQRDTMASEEVECHTKSRAVTPVHGSCPDFSLWISLVFR